MANFTWSTPASVNGNLPSAWLTTGDAVATRPPGPTDSAFFDAFAGNTNTYTIPTPSPSRTPRQRPR
jgi:hypothetical protein